MGSQRLSKSRWQQAENTLLDSWREIGKTMWPKVRDPPDRTMGSFVSFEFSRWFKMFPLFGGFRLYGLHRLHCLHPEILTLEPRKWGSKDIPRWSSQKRLWLGYKLGFMGLRPPLRPSSWSRQSPAAALTLECSQADALSSKGSTKARRKRPDCCKPKLAMIRPTNFKLEARHLAAWWTFILWGRLYPVGILATQRLYEITMQL